LIARFPFGDENVVGWWDTNHQRMFVVKKITTNEPDLLKWEDTRGRKFTLRPMTLQSYNAKVKPKLSHRPSFKTLAEVQSHFLVAVSQFV
jgi:hypothetical protein